MRIINKIIKEYKRIVKNKCVFFVYDPHKQIYISEGLSINICCAKSIEDINKKGMLDTEMEDIFGRRFDKGELCFFCVNNRRLISYGWVCEHVSSFYLYEIASNVHLSRPVNMLYDFWVHPQYRGRKIYSEMLLFICDKLVDCKSNVIYAEENNSISLRAINNVGFSEVGRVSFFRRKVRVYL